MNQKIKIWLWILAWILLTLIVTYFIWKNEENKKLGILWINQKQAQEIKNELKSYENRNKSDSLSDDEINFFESNWLKKDSHWLYYTYDKYQLDWVMIYFKKENWEWKWSILLWNWDNLDDYKYDNTSSIYNWYVIKQDKTKKIFEKLSWKQINNTTSENIVLENKNEVVKKYENQDIIDKFKESFNKKMNWIRFINPNLVNFEKYLVSATNIQLIEIFDDVKHYSKYEWLWIALAYYEWKDENWNQIYMDSLEEFNLDWKNYILNEITNRKWNIYWYLIMDKDNFEIYIMQKL